MDEKRKEVLKYLIEKAADYEDGENGLSKCLELFCEDLIEEAVKLYEKEYM